MSDYACDNCGEPTDGQALCDWCCSFFVDLKPPEPAHEDEWRCRQDTPLAREAAAARGPTGLRQPFPPPTPGVVRRA